MQNFLKALTSGGKNIELPEEFDYFGKLIGSWKVEYIDNSTSHSLKGEWHFSWILDGMAIQDVIVLPGYEHGTTLRIYNPLTHAWDVAYGYTGKIMRFEAKRQDGMIILTNIKDERRKWVFAEIGDNDFHWQDIRVDDDGKWHFCFDLYAHRI